MTVGGADGVEIAEEETYYSESCEELDELFVELKVEVHTSPDSTQSTRYSLWTLLIQAELRCLTDDVLCLKETDDEDRESLEVVEED